MTTLFSDIDVRSFLKDLPYHKRNDVKELLKIFFTNVNSALPNTHPVSALIAKLNLNSFLSVIEYSDNDVSSMASQILNTEAFTTQDMTSARELLNEIIQKNLTYISKTISGVGNIDEVISFIDKTVLPKLQNKTNQTHALSQLEQSTF